MKKKILYISIIVIVLIISFFVTQFVDGEKLKKHNLILEKIKGKNEYESEIMTFRIKEKTGIMYIYTKQKTGVKRAKQEVNIDSISVDKNEIYIKSTDEKNVSGVIRMKELENEKIEFILQVDGKEITTTGKLVKAN